MTMMSDWTEGKPCERHDMMYCADCQASAGMRRTADGGLAYKKDCAVQSFVELTGAGYEEAVGYLREAGFRPGVAGTPQEGVVKALQAVGYTVREVTHYRIGTLASRKGSFVISGQKGRKGHSWTVVDGVPSRAYQPPFRYRIWEVTA
jgi:hypothetical protein